MHREESPRARPADAENRGMNAWIHCKRFDSPNVTEAAGLTQWGSSWRRERVPVKTTGMQKPQIRKNCGNLWKSDEPGRRNSYRDLGTSGVSPGLRLTQCGRKYSSALSCPGK